MPTLSFGGGKTDITDRPDRLLGNITITEYPSIIIDSTNIIASDESLPPFKIKKKYPSNGYLIFNQLPNNGCLARNNVVELANTLITVNDVRHSPDLDNYDYTPISVDSSGNSGITVDYGQIYNVKEIYVYAPHQNYMNGFYIDISQDGTNWTTVYSASAGGKAFILNQTLRYLRVRLKATMSITGYIYKIILTR
jgi:hypothetical protein